MAILATQIAPKNSVLAAMTVAAATASDTFANTGKEAVYVENTNGATRDIAVTPGGSGNATIGDGTLAAVGAVGSGFTIAATTGRSMIGILDRSVFGDAPVLTPSAAAGISFAIVRLA